MYLPSEEIAALPITLSGDVIAMAIAVPTILCAGAALLAAVKSDRGDEKLNGFTNYSGNEQ